MGSRPSGGLPVMEASTLLSFDGALRLNATVPPQVQGEALARYRSRARGIHRSPVPPGGASVCRSRARCHGLSSLAIVPCGHRKASSGVELDRWEEELDAHVCACVAVYHWTHGSARCRVVTDAESGDIVAPVTDEMAWCLDTL